MEDKIGDGFVCVVIADKKTFMEWSLHSVLESCGTGDGRRPVEWMRYKFRVPTLRLEQLVRSEDHRGEIQGESGESQLAEPTDDAEAREDSWSIQRDFINREHTESGDQRSSERRIIPCSTEIH